MPPSVGIILCLALRVAHAGAADGAPSRTALAHGGDGPSPVPVPASPDLPRYHATQDIPTWLPRSLHPLYYSVRVRPILAEGNFTAPGVVEFTFEVKEPTRRIVVNVRDLAIDKLSTTVQEEMMGACKWKGIDIENQNQNSELETFEVGVGETLKQGGRYRLTLRYVALIQNNLKGLYRSYYEDENRNKRWIAVTQLGPTNARAFFPCMDEPQYKARFTLSIARQDQYKSVSNMPLRAIEPIAGEPGWVWDHFHTSVPMSTYLVAVAVFDYDRLGPDPDNRLSSTISANHTDVVHGLFGGGGAGTGTDTEAPLGSGNSSDVVFGVWAPKAKVSRGAYAAGVGPRVLQFFSEFFNLSFPLPKQDMIMVPQFHFAAMENWGLIMYRESDLLVDESKPDSMSRVAHTVAHELAHQWFGNLVTMKWWNDIWLNEGFATYMSQVGVSFVEPRWNSEHLFIVDNARAVMKRDATATSHPVSQRIRKVSDIDLIFDSISYKKGASIIRMMSDFLGERAFHRGLNAYLRKYRYKNAAQDDLWESLTEAARREGVLLQNESVKEVMDTWTLHTGYPVVTVERNYSLSTARVVQERFLLGGSQGLSLGRSSVDGEQPVPFRWWVPLWVTSASAPSSTVQWLRGVQHTTLRDLPPGNHWVLVNAKQSGYYRVNYDERNWRLLTDAMKDLPELARVGLVDDALALADAGMLKYSIALRLVDRIPRGQASVTWVAAVPWLRRIRHLTHGEGEGSVGRVDQSFSTWAKKAAASLYSLLPKYKNSSDPIESRFFTQVKAWACELGVQACLMDVANKLHPLTKTTEVDTPDRWVLELCSSMERQSSKDALEMDFIEKYDKYDYGAFQNILKCLRNSVASERLLHRIFARNTTQHAPHAVMSDMLKSPNTHAAAMNFLKENVVDLKARHQRTFSDEDLILAAQLVKTEEHYSLMARILHEKDQFESQMALEQGRHNIWWLQNQLNDLASTIQLL